MNALAKSALRHERALAAAMLAVGLAVRLAYAWTHPPPMRGHEALHDRLARNVAEGRGYSYDGARPFFYPAPLYPSLLAGFYGAGGSPRAAALVQSGLDVATAWLSWSVARTLFGAAPALLTLALVAFYPAFWTWAARLYMESLLGFLNAGLAWCLLRVLDRERPLEWALAGLALAASTLTRSHTIAFPLAVLPLVLMSAARPAWGPRARVWLVFAAVSLAPLLPWAWRNSILLGRPAGVSSGVGVTLWHGSYWPWEGSDPVPADDWSEFWKAAGAEYPEIFYPEVDRRLELLARARISAEPLRFAGLALRKTFYFWVGNRVFLFGRQGGLSAAFDEDRRTRGVPVAAYSLAKRLFLLPALLAAAALGAWAERERWRRWWPVAAIPAYATAVHMVLVVECGRYHVPLLPLVFVLSGAGLARLLRLEEGR